MVVLVDEYDKPILDNINNTQVAQRNKRCTEEPYYGVLKEQDANLQFIFMTGVTKFSKVNLFSGLNQLIDITIDEESILLFAVTQTMDLQEHFSEYLAGSDPEEVKRWYNGYSWTGPESVYNPYDILLVY